MKKLFFAFTTLALVTSATSCNKCGYCKMAGQQNGDAVCQTSNPIESLDGESYKQAKADCSADGGTWVITK